jgi:hypothetical protein
MMNAPNVIRMAIGIGTANSFTIKELSHKLCQQTCDMGCGNPAPYIDVFTLSRRCLWVGGPCDMSNGPQTVESFIRLSNYTGPLDSSEFDVKVPSIALIKGAYGNMEFGSGSGRFPDKACYCDYDDALSFFATTEVQKDFFGSRWRQQDKYSSVFPRHSYHQYWKLTAVFAPFLDTQGKSAKYEAFCTACTEKEAEERRTKSVRPWGMWYQSKLPDLTRIAFGTADWLAEHEETEHND